MKKYSQVNVSPSWKTLLKRGYQQLLFGVAMGLLGGVILLYTFLPDYAPFENPLFAIGVFLTYICLWGIFLYGTWHRWDLE